MLQCKKRFFFFFLFFFFLFFLFLLNVIQPAAVEGASASDVEMAESASASSGERIF